MACICVRRRLHKISFDHLASALCYRSCQRVSHTSVYETCLPLLNSNRGSFCFHRHYFSNPISKFSACYSSLSSAIVNDAIKKATLNCGTVINANLNIDERFKDLNTLEENIRRRRLRLDVRHLYADYCRLMELEQEKISLEKQRRENADIMKYLLKEQKSQQLDVEKTELIQRGKLIKSKLKNLLNDDYFSLYKRVSNDMLHLPVDLYSTTLDNDAVVAEFGCKQEFSFKPLNHLILGKKMKTMRFDVKGNCYLLDEIALLEHSLLNNVIGKCLKLTTLQHMVCPDMVKAFVVEGCGCDLSEMFEVEGKTSVNIIGEEVVEKSTDHNLVLTGVSCSSFAAYMLAMNVHQKSLPLKFYSIGRTYNPAADKEIGLFSTSQANCAALFGATESIEKAEMIFDEFLSIVLSLYKSINIPIRVVQVGASSLRSMESKRIDIYVWSTGFQNYFKCGEVRMCNDYISRHLSIKVTNDFNDDISGDQYVHTVDGIILRIPVVIATLMEHYQTQDGVSRMPKFT